MRLDELYKKITVYHYMITFLSVLGLVGIFTTQDLSLVPQLVLAPILAAALDYAVTYLQYKRKIIPQSAIISGLFVATILPANLLAAVAGVVIVVAGKHIIRFNERHIFNPAGFGILVSALLFGTGTAWWSSASLLIIPLGLFISYKIQRLYISLPFLAIFAVGTAITNVIRGIAITPISFLNLATIFMAFFMAVEPRTTPHTKKGMLIFAAILGIAYFVTLFLTSNYNIAADFMLLSLLFTNVFTENLNKLS